MTLRPALDTPRIPTCCQCGVGLPPDVFRFRWPLVPDHNGQPVEANAADLALDLAVCGRCAAKELAQRERRAA